MKRLNKKGIASSFDIAGKVGYYILTLMIVSVLFLFVAVILQGTELHFYKNNHGTSAISIEEKVFSHLAFTDPITHQTYAKTVDVATFLATTDPELDSIMGITDQYDPKGVRVELFNDKWSAIGNPIQTSNYVHDRQDITSSYPVLIQQGKERIVGKIQFHIIKP